MPMADYDARLLAALAWLTGTAPQAWRRVPGEREPDLPQWRRDSRYVRADGAGGAAQIALDDKRLATVRVLDPVGRRPDRFEACFAGDIDTLLGLSRLRRPSVAAEQRSPDKAAMPGPKRPRHVARVTAGVQIPA